MFDVATMPVGIFCNMNLQIESEPGTGGTEKLEVNCERDAVSVEAFAEEEKEPRMEPRYTRQMVQNTVFVRNLAPQLTDKDLRAFFSTCGALDDLEVHTYQVAKRAPARYARVLFRTRHGFHAAEHVNGTPLFGIPIVVEYTDPNPQLTATRMLAEDPVSCDTWLNADAIAAGLGSTRVTAVEAAILKSTIITQQLAQTTYRPVLVCEDTRELESHVLDRTLAFTGFVRYAPRDMILEFMQKLGDVKHMRTGLLRTSQDDSTPLGDDCQYALVEFRNIGDAQNIVSMKTIQFGPITIDISPAKTTVPTCVPQELLTGSGMRDSGTLPVRYSALERNKHDVYIAALEIEQRLGYKRPRNSTRRYEPRR